MDEFLQDSLPQNAPELPAESEQSTCVTVNRPQRFQLSPEFQEAASLSFWVSSLSKTRNPSNLRHALMLRPDVGKCFMEQAPTRFQYSGATLWSTVAITSFWINQNYTDKTVEINK